MKTSEALLKIFHRPREVFAAQRKKPEWGRILLLVVALSLIVSTMREFSTPSVGVDDSDKNVDQSVAIKEMGSSDSNLGTSTSTKNSAVVNSLVRSVERDSVTYRTRFVNAFPSVFTAVFELIAFLLLFFVEALYLRIVSAILRLDIKMDQWLGLVAWSHVPYQALITLTTIVLVTALFVFSELLGFESVVLTHLIEGPSPSDSTFHSWLDIWLFAEIWVIALCYIGFREWSGKGKFLSFAVVITPSILHFGLLWWVFA